MSYVECLIFILDYEEPHPSQPEPPKQDFHPPSPPLSGYALLPRFEPELEKRCLSLFSLEHVHVIRVGEECPDALTAAVRSDRVSIVNFLLCPSERAVYNDSIPAPRKSHFFTVEVLTMKHVFNSEKPMTYKDTRTVFKDDGCLLFMFVLIQHRADINFVSKAGTTFLHLAIFKGCDLLIRFLVRNGASIGTRTRKDETALHMAIRFRLPDATLKHLIERLTVADINATMTGVGYNGVTPLQLALRHVSSLESIECLLDNGADVNACDKDGCSIVKEAVWRHPEALPRILAQGSLSRTGVLRKVLKLRLVYDSNYFNDISQTPRRFSTPDISGSIAKLLDHGFDLDPEDAEDVGALLDAVRAGNIELVLRLLRWGASLTDEWNGMTALHTAAAHASPSMIRALLDHGADINLRTKHVPRWGTRPLTSAACSGNIEAMTCLLEEGAKLEDHPCILYDVILSSFRGTPRLIETVKFLVNVGVDVNPPYSWRPSPATMAFIHGEEDIARVLVKCGGILSAVEALRSSRKKGKLETLIDLLRIDAKLDMRPVIFEAFSSHTSSLASFILMLEYPVAVSVELAIGNPLRDFPCSFDVLLIVLELEYLRFTQILYPRELPFQVRNIYFWDKDLTSGRDDIILRHLACLETAAFKINNWMSNTEHELKYREAARDLAEEYALAREVAAMKEKYIQDTGTSFYDILEATIPQILNFLQNNTLAVFEALMDSESYVQFPTFRGMIRRRSCKAYFRKMLLDQGVKMLDVLMTHNGYTLLQSKNKLKIVDYLSNAQLLAFSKTCTLPSDHLFVKNLINLTWKCTRG